MLQPGALLQGKYTIEKVIGQGGMGAVYLSRMLTLGGKRVAIKEMAVPLMDEGERRKAVEQFQREALMLATLEHPGLVDVFDHFEEDGNQYLVMALVDGQTLGDVLLHSPTLLDVGRVLDWADQLCDVLQYLHAQTPPVIFRDIKPNNIMLDAHQRIRLVDFGIARFFESTSHTATFIKGAGTAGFSPIEQFGGGTTDVRSDIYSLGCTLYTLLTGAVPPAAPALISKEAELVRPSLQNPRTPPELEAVVLKMMGLLKEQRYQTMQEVRQALRRVASALPRVPCATCGQTLDPGARVCSHCGAASADVTAPLKMEAGPQNYATAVSVHVCGGCGAMMTLADAVCPRCHAPRRAALPPTERAPAPPAVHRPSRTLPILIGLAALATGVAIFRHGTTPGAQPVASPTPGAHFSFAAAAASGAVAASRDGHLLAAVAEYGDHADVLVWDLPGGHQTSIKGAKHVQSIAISPNDTTLAIGDYGDLMSSILLRDLRSDSVSARLQFADNPPVAPPDGLVSATLEFSSDNQWLSTSGVSQRIWNIETGEQLKQYPRGGDISMSPDGTRALSADYNTKNIMVYDLRTGDMVGVFNMLSGRERQVPYWAGWLTNGAVFLAPRRHFSGAAVYVRSLGTGGLMASQDVVVPGAVDVSRPVPSADGGLLACRIDVQEDKTKPVTPWVYVWDTRSWAVRAHFTPGPGAGAIDFLPDGRLAVSTYDPATKTATITLRPLDSL